MHSYVISMLPAEACFAQCFCSNARCCRNHMCISGRQEVPNISLIEVLGHGHWRLHCDVPGSIDAILAGTQPQTQLRMHKHGKLLVRRESSSFQNEASPNLGSDQSCNRAAMFD